MRERDCVSDLASQRCGCEEDSFTVKYGGEALVFFGVAA